LKKILIGAAVLAVAAVPAVALAQNPAPEVKSDVSISPSQAGTSKKPAAAKFTFKVQNSPESKSTLKQVVLDLPKGVKFDGTKLPKCAADELNTQGVRACPSGSKLGTGVSYAFVINPAAASPDCVGTGGGAPGCLTFSTTFFVGGPKVLTVWLVQRGGGVVKAFDGKITNSGRRLSITIPDDLQQPATGVFSALSQLAGSFKATKTVSGKKYSFVSTTSCPSSKKWKVKSKLVYGTNQFPAPPAVSGSDSVSCKK
jgi:hypothetical protein